MNLELSHEALEFGRTALAALEKAGGASAEGVVDVLGELGAWELDPFAGPLDLEAAAALCRSTGYWSVPYPVSGRLCRPRDLGADGLVAVDSGAPAGVLGGQSERWVAVDLDGHRSWVRPSPPGRRLQLEPIDRAGGDGVVTEVVLACWSLLGMLDRTVVLTRAHVLEREQFGQPLAAFQGVQFQLVEAEVERNGLEALAQYTLWRIVTRPDEALVDALALRLAALEAAEAVFRVGHQLHGALGFCDETELSWVSRRSQPLRRLPLGLSTTRRELAQRVGRWGLTGIYGPGEVPYPF